MTPNACRNGRLVTACLAQTQRHQWEIHPWPSTSWSLWEPAPTNAIKSSVFPASMFKCSPRVRAASCTAPNACLAKQCMSFCVGALNSTARSSTNAISHHAWTGMSWDWERSLTGVASPSHTAEVWAFIYWVTSWSTSIMTILNRMSPTGSPGLVPLVVSAKSLMPSTWKKVPWKRSLRRRWTCMETPETAWSACAWPMSSATSSGLTPRRYIAVIKARSSSCCSNKPCRMTE